MLRKITYERRIDFKVDADLAIRLRNEGMTLREIREYLPGKPSIATISRALRRTSVTTPAAA
jgi:hypothetical protein